MVFSAYIGTITIWTHAVTEIEEEPSAPLFFLGGNLHSQGINSKSDFFRVLTKGGHCLQLLLLWTKSYHAIHDKFVMCWTGFSGSLKICAE